ncbi:MAG: DUF5343 domain-containing protein [Bacteroidetes bacterium]|nr:DUF5343 domain-containing protein [Bacteroidota bacterium]
MALPDSYTVKYGSFAAYFDAIQGAEPPERFSVKFLENLEFKSTNDRALVGILRELGFLDSNNVPTKRYYEYLDKAAAPRVLAEGIREMFSDLFAIKKDANKMTSDEAYNKLRTLYAGSKKDNLVKLIAKSFSGLCELADFESSKPEVRKKVEKEKEEEQEQQNSELKDKAEEQSSGIHKKIKLQGLQYHINIVLPETRDQAIYDAIFKSLRDHLG